MFNYYGSIMYGRGFRTICSRRAGLTIRRWRKPHRASQVLTGGLMQVHQIVDLTLSDPGLSG